MLAANLSKAGAPAITGPNSLVFRFPAGYNQAREYCESPEQLARESKTRHPQGHRQALDGPHRSGCHVGQRPARRQSEPVNGVERVRPRRGAKEEAEKVPLVKRAVEMLGATIQRVDDDFGEPPPIGGRQAGPEEA